MTAAPKQSDDPVSLEDLARRAQSGDRTALDELTERVRPRLRSFLIGKVQSDADADDLTQDALLRACRHIDRYNPQYRFTTWLFTIAARLAASHYRSQRPETPLFEELLPGGDGQSAADRHIQKTLWIRAHEMLSDREYAALYLRYVEGHSIAEVAKKLSLSSVHAKVILYRCRRRLEKEFRQ